jgi:hypothetical protein
MSSSPILQAAPVNITSDSFRFNAYSLVRSLIFIAAVQLFLASGTSHAKARMEENVDLSAFEEDFDDLQKPWEEIAVQIPAQPKQENLVSFEPLNATASYSFEIDDKSLTLGSDGVIRYIVVATSRSGAKNISYEGIRCSTFEKKLYAFGRQDGSWARSRQDKWERIVRRTGVNYQETLALEYFCQNKTVAGTPKDMLRRIRYKEPLNRRELPGDGL